MNATPNPDDPFYLAESQLVQIFLTVTDGSRRIADLKTTDFSLLEDGVSVGIERMDNAEVPLFVAFLLHTSEKMRNALQFTREAAVSFVRSLKSGDRVVLIPFNSDIRAIPHEYARRFDDAMLTISRSE